MTSAISQTIESWRSRLPIIRIERRQKVGVATAWNEAIQISEKPWIARMDSDDIAMPDRFEKQVRFLEANPTIDILGGQIDEFLYNPDSIEYRRAVPTEHDDIVRTLAYSNPFNHMTVMMRRTAHQAVGGYQNRGIPGYIDYSTWARMLASGATGANLPNVLVKARIGNGLFGRRKGWRFLKTEIRFTIQLYRLEYVGFFKALALGGSRSLLRLLPEKVMKVLYQFFRRVWAAKVGER